MVPKHWLKCWITGLWSESSTPTDSPKAEDALQSSIIDLTQSAEQSRLSNNCVPGVIFNKPPSEDLLFCRHKKGICPSKLKYCKVISDVAYATIMSTLDPHKMPWEFTTETAYCGQCVREFSENIVACRRMFDVLQDMLKLVNRGTQNEFDSYVISRTWLTHLRKTFEQLRKETTENMKQVESFFKEVCSPNQLSNRMDMNVNRNICCVHGKLRKGFKRNSVLVSKEAWAMIRSTFPGAIEFKSFEDNCAECIMLDTAEETRKEELQEERGIQLEDPSLRELVKLLKRKPYYPVELDKEEFLREFSPKRFCLIDSKWLRAWHSYIVDITVPAPGKLMLHLLTFILFFGRSLAE